MHKADKDTLLKYTLSACAAKLIPRALADRLATTNLPDQFSCRQRNAFNFMPAATMRCDDSADAYGFRCSRVALHFVVVLSFPCFPSVHAPTVIACPHAVCPSYTSYPPRHRSDVCLCSLKLCALNPYHNYDKS